MTNLNYSRNSWRNADLDDYIDATETVVNLVGIDYAGIGSDFNHGGAFMALRTLAKPRM